LVLGSTSNTATLATGLAFTGDASGSYGIGVTDHGLDSFNKSAAIAGHTQGNFECAVLGYDTSAEGRYAVYGQTNVAGVAVLGLGISPLSKGVVGVGGSRGLIGQCEGSGAKSIGVLALASQPDATALAVNGVFRARRATVPQGQRVKTVPLSPLTSTALVVATVQKVSGDIAVQAVTVKTSSPTSFTIRLNANAPAGGMPVAWVVIDTMGTALS
jgi:hypothetical protein